MIITEWDQGTPEWKEERLGVPSASCFKKIVNKKGERSKQRLGYMYILAGEIITGEQHKGYYGKQMELGNEREDESRSYFEITTGLDVEQVGFCYKDEKRLFGASPDGLIGNDAGFESKNAEPHLQAQRINEGWSDTDHHRQVQGCMLVTGRKLWYLVSYCRGMKQVVLEIKRDDDFIRKLEIELIIFHKDLHELVESIQA